MQDIDIFSDENFPKISFSETVYRIHLPHTATQQLSRVAETPYRIYIGVDHTGNVSLHRGTQWYGKSLDKMSYHERMEVYEFLTELEIVSWHAVGPEDSELFVTDMFRDLVKGDR